MDYFVELYAALPRGGPGDNASTRRAFEMMAYLPPEPRILDVGCGPGMQTIELLRLSAGTVVALDILPQMIARVRQAAASEGFADRLETVQADMNDMDFEPASFDAVWSEGAIYFLGFEKGLAKVQQLVKPGGYVAVSEAVWLEPDPPREVVDFWQAYSGIDTVERKLDVVSGLGYQNVNHFVLPVSSWTGPYYDPLAKRIPAYQRQWQGIAAAEEVLSEARKEISIFKKYSRYYGYAFFVMRRCSGMHFHACMQGLAIDTADGHGSNGFAPVYLRNPRHPRSILFSLIVLQLGVSGAFHVRNNRRQEMPSRLAPECVVVMIAVLGITLSSFVELACAQITWMDWPSPDEQRPSYTIRPDENGLRSYDSPDFDEYLGEYQEVEVYQPEHHVYRVPFRYKNVSVDGWLEYNDKGIELLADVGAITIVEEKPIVSVTIVGSGCCSPNYNIVEWWGEGESMGTVRGQLPKRSRIDSLKGIHVAWQQEAFTKPQKFDSVEQANRFIADLQKVVYAQTSGHTRHGSVLPGMYENTAYFRVGDVNVFGKSIIAPGPNIRRIIDRQEVHKVVIRGGGMDYENPGCTRKGVRMARHPADYAVRLIDVAVKK